MDCVLDGISERSKTLNYRQMFHEINNVSQIFQRTRMKEGINV